MRSIDLNCDLGEGAGHDAELMPLVSSANIACGGHAGDEVTMAETVELALEHGVAIGAHPGFADRDNFGRRELPVTPEEAGELVEEQTRELATIAARLGAKLHHVKLHGAIYNMAARDPALAEAVTKAVLGIDRQLVFYVPFGSRMALAAKRLGLPVAHEVFADRTYRRDGSLTPRSQTGALIADENTAVAQVLRMVREGKVRATDGSDVEVYADTVCLHGDGVHAVAFAHRLREELARAGVELKSCSRGRGPRC